MTEKKKTNKELILGIDLGTTYSCVGIWKNRKVEIVPNEIGERTTPSVVSFSNNCILVGKQAKKQITKNYNNTIYGIKRLIGRNYDDEIIQKDMKLWPFKLEKDENNKALICIEYKNKEEKYYPEQISAMILENIKKNAEVFLGEEVKDVVITVPAYFNNAQRQATIDAGKIAGLNVMKTINEPTAAAIAYGLNDHFEGKRNICVFDLGGGTFDVTILEINNKKFTVKATGGDTHLGGEDFDNLLMKYCIEQFKNETDIDISDDQKALRRLKIACETVKTELSSLQESIIDIDCLAQHEDFTITIKRKDFETICKELFEKCIRKVEEILSESGLSKDEINEIILIGGSSRIPKIQEIINDFFGDNSKICKTVNLDEAVAIGASIVCYLEENNEFNPIELYDVCPFSLGIETKNNKMSVLIKRNSRIPQKFISKFKTTRDYQKNVCVNVYEGESDDTRNNVFVNSFFLQNIKSAPKGKVLIEITFELDFNSILNVKAKEIGNEGNCKIIKIKKKIRNEDEIERMIEEQKKISEDNLKWTEKINEKNKLEKCLIQLKKMKNNNSQNNLIDQKYKEMKDWIKNNSNEDIRIFNKKRKELEDFIQMYQNK